MNTSQEIGLPWHIVESAIQKEKDWLRNMFDFGQQRDRFDANLPNPLSEDEMLRQISLAILRGGILAREIRSEKINSLWMEDSEEWELTEMEERHGGAWHRAMISIVKKYFLSEGFDVVDEPFLNHGRADLGTYREDAKNLYIEIGSTTLFKTWINLQTMPESLFLFVPSVNYALEFRTK